MNNLAWILVILLSSLLSAGLVHQLWLLLESTQRDAFGAAGVAGLATFTIGMALYNVARTS